MQSKPGLGRGLGALLSSTPVEGDTLMQIRVDQVEANPNQPRKRLILRLWRSYRLRSDPQG